MSTVIFYRRQLANIMEMQSTHVRSPSSISSFRFLRRWWRLTSRMMRTMIMTKAPAAAPTMMISNRLSALVCSGSRVFSGTGARGAEVMISLHSLIHTLCLTLSLIKLISSDIPHVCSSFNVDWDNIHASHHKGAAKITQLLQITMYIRATLCFEVDTQTLASTSHLLPLLAYF